MIGPARPSRDLRHSEIDHETYATGLVVTD
jgi:hypothetical protein